MSSDRNPMLVLGGERGGRNHRGIRPGQFAHGLHSPTKVFGQDHFIHDDKRRTQSRQRMPDWPTEYSDRSHRSTGGRLSTAAAARAGQVDILCAGTGGSVTREDVLAAGAIVAHELLRIPGSRMGNQRVGRKQHEVSGRN